MTTRPLDAIAHRMMIERGLEPDFSTAVLSEVAGLREAAPPVGPDVRDLRERPWASIDNDTSRDLDQLSVAEPLPGGAVKVLVAIADVDAMVKRGSAIDDHARANTTSVYTAAGIFPMLPERLSTDLTSLGPGKDRAAMVVEMVVDGGAVTGSSVYRAVVRNHAQLAYNAVAAWLDGAGPAPAALLAVAGLDEQIRIQDRVAQALRGLRFQRGALSLQTPRAEAVFDADRLLDLRADVPNRAKELIEDLMVAANGVTARLLADRGFPSLRRVLQAPARWPRIVALAEGLGETLPADPSARALSDFLVRRRAQDPVRFPELSLSIVKLLGRGQYALERPGQRAEGHFGLAVSDYTHSTAPNRRFPDLVTQRLLKAALAGAPPPYSDGELGALASHCSTQEEGAEKVERQVGKSAAALLLASRVGERFDGLVTGASAKGTWVRVSRPPVEGRLVRGFQGLDVGDAVRVELTHTDVERGYIDFARSAAG